MKHTRIFTALLTLSALLVPTTAVTGTAVAATKQQQVAVRSFPSQRAAQKSDLLSEARSVTSSTTSSWGGIESLSVPKTESDTDRRNAAAQQAQQQAQQQAASRSQQRQALSSQDASRSSASSSAPSVSAPASKTAQSLASFAQQFTSVPYVFGGNTPAGWDCSGFTQWIFSNFGVSLPRTAAEQRAYAQAHGQRHSTPQVGDLMAMNDGSHMAIYLGNGMMMHAPLPGMHTQIIPVYSSRFEYYGML